jgi:hypothetical protein
MERAMSETPATPTLPETFARPTALVAVQVGMASPLWGLFAGAAIGGSAWWWMTRWARPENLEAMFAAAEAAPALTSPVAMVEYVAEIAVEAANEAEPVAEPAIEAAIEAVEAIIDPPVLDEPVGGEAAPIAPALAAEPEPALEPVAAAPEPKPRSRKAEPKPD